MEHALVDLDVLRLSVRNPYSRKYIDEAILAYRAGSLKASIVATWVAVTYDILEKIRELSEDGDAQAREFIYAFDNNVRNNNKTKLLEIESNLIKYARDKFQFINAIEEIHLTRLKEDRNYCAHPTFTEGGALFSPKPELVRLYIVEAIKIILCQFPTQGNAILSRLNEDIKGDLFPKDRAGVIRFVNSRYLSKLRESSIKNFGDVVLKAVFKELPEGWPSQPLLAICRAVADHSPTLWNEHFSQFASQLIDSAPSKLLANAFLWCREFPDIQAKLSPAAHERMVTLIRNFDEENGQNTEVFDCILLEEFQKEGVYKFKRCSNLVKNRILNRRAHEAFWPVCLDVMSESSSYRGAEDNFDKLIIPFMISRRDRYVQDVLNRISKNDQIYDAAKIPRILKFFIEGIKILWIDGDDITDFFDMLREDDYRIDRYADVVLSLKSSGVTIPVDLIGKLESSSVNESAAPAPAPADNDEDDVPF
ncbi:hypothetical protein [uncultured Sphingosinicella sp.]|uniref:hypothetical protein n=1 Tax=uncultured Sphingosinicella sp. TaxID=478748 RepID=UPI0030D70A77